MWLSYFRDLYKDLPEEDQTPEQQQIATKLSDMEEAIKDFQETETFFGDRARFSNFKNSCELYFKLRPLSSGTETQQRFVGFVTLTMTTEPKSIEQQITETMTLLNRTLPQVGKIFLNKSSSSSHSKAWILNSKPTYCVDDIVIVRVQMFNYLGERKTYGGDFHLARIYSPQLQAGASGRIEDFNNGSYNVYFTLFWEGQTYFSILLMHPSEGVAVLWKHRNMGVKFNLCFGKFLNNSREVEAECGFNLDAQKEQCKYENAYGETFYCVKMPGVHCEALISMRTEKSPIDYFTDTDKALLASSNIGKEIPKHFQYIDAVKCSDGETVSQADTPSEQQLEKDIEELAMEVAGQHVGATEIRKFKKTSTYYPSMGINPNVATFTDLVTAEVEQLSKKPKHQSATKNVTRKCETGVTPPFPGGFFLKSHWSPLHCDLPAFEPRTQIEKCLAGKMIYLMGDSTLRQWIEFLPSVHPDLKDFDNHGVGWHKKFQAFDLKNNIYMQWKKHGHPFLSIESYTVRDHSYITEEIDRLAGGPNTVVVFNVGQHFRPFPLQIFIRRLYNIRDAVENLFLRSPDTKVILKSENTRELYSDVERFSDFHGYVQYQLVKEIFRGLNVGVIDVWDITVAAASFKVHPERNVVENQINFFLSYVC
ncbi:NXPE family member 1-like [Gastrophryne carolinensis]